MWFALSKLFMSEDEIIALKKRYETPGQGYGHFKLSLFEKMSDYFEPFLEKRAYYLKHPEEIDDILEYGKTKAQKIAQTKIEKIRELVGLTMPKSQLDF